jgi:plasmid maintenance system antidote protein VapI
LYLRDWTQEELAVQLGVTQAMISGIINQKRKLHPKRRQLAEELLEQSEQSQQPI